MCGGAGRGRLRTSTARNGPGCGGGMKTLSIPAALKWIGAGIAAQWVQLPGPLQTLLVFMAADYASGLLVAWQKKELSSDRGRRGLIKKVQVLILIGVAHWLEPLGLQHIHAEQIVIYGFLVTELISIVENAHRGGVPIPAPLVAALLAAKKLQKTATPE